MATPPPPNPKELLKAGLEHYRFEQYDQAIAVLKTVTNEDPVTFSQAVGLLGRCHTRRKEYDAALELLAYSLRIRPIPQTQFYLGEAYYYQGDYPSAASALENAIAGDDKLTDAFILLGTIRRNEGNLDAATKAFDRALRNDPKAIAARFHLAQTAYDLGDLQRATSQAYMILQQNEAFAPVHLLLGHCALRLNDFRQAAYEYCRSLQLQEHPSIEIYEGLARAFANLKDFGQALKAFEAVIAMDSTHEMAHVAGARLAERLGETERAKALWHGAARFPAYADMAAQSLAKLGAEAPKPTGKGKKTAPKPMAVKPILTAELPRDFSPPQLIDKSAIPQRAAQSFPTAPLSTHAAGTLSLSSRQPKETQPLTRSIPIETYEAPVESPAKQLFAPIAHAFSELFKAKPKPPEPAPVETIADMIAKRKNNPQG